VKEEVINLFLEETFFLKGWIRGYENLLREDLQHDHKGQVFPKIS
jgi:hypothetical protein